MATIYRIIAEQGKGGSGGSSGGRKNTRKPKGAGKTTNLFGGSRGGVEHNRYMRAINPVLNRATNGYWEKGTRLGRAGMGIATKTATSGFGSAFMGVGMTIIISFILQWLIRWNDAERIRAQKLNAQNYKMLENGVGAIHSAYSVSVNGLTGRQTYNQNK